MRRRYRPQGCGDKNAIVVFDTCSNNEFARFDMKARGENAQFINLIGERVLCCDRP
jgi:hypothetical protein